MCVWVCLCESMQAYKCVSLDFVSLNAYAIHLMVVKVYLNSSHTAYATKYCVAEI